MRKKTKADKLGIALADVVMKTGHMTYNAYRGRRIVAVCIEVLQKRIGEIQPKKADPKYKEARYGKKKKSKRS